MIPQLLTLSLLAGSICIATEVDPLAEWLRRSNGVYSLHESAAAGDLKQLLLQLNNDADPNAADEEGNSPLHLAIAAVKPDIVKALIAAGADPLATDAAGRSAIDCCTDATVRELCQAAAECRLREIRVSDDLSHGRVFRVAAALEQGVSANARYRDNSGSLLMQAVRESRPHMVRLLIRHGADVNASAPGGESILQAAALQKNPWIVQDLLTAGANPMQTNDNLATPLHEAVWADNEITVRVLLPAYKHCNYSPDGAHNDTPLHLAIVRKNLRLVQLFIEAGIDLNHAAFEKTPLLPFAAAKGTPEIEQLLKAAGAR